jgi:hypothetical protein
MKRCLVVAAFSLLPAADLRAQPALKQEPNTWVKRSPLKDGPVSPGMGYETSLGYDPKARLVIRWGGHNQGGGGEQNAETWTFDPLTAKWTLREPNTSPPGVCCAQQNVFDLDHGRFLRFPAFSGNHGWHWFRENYLSNSSVWSYDLRENSWRDMRPLPAPRVAPLRCASWDSDHGVAVVFGGEGSNEGTLVYDPWTNTWTRMKPKNEQLAPRSGGNMTYDAANKLHVLFGSQFGDDPHTWTYDLRKNEWRDCKPAIQPPTDRNDPVLAYDPNGKVTIALVRVVDVRDKQGIDREQQIWTYRHGKEKPGVSPVAEMTVGTEEDAAVLSWSTSPEATGYILQRGKGEQPWRAVMRTIHGADDLPSPSGQKFTGIRDQKLKPEQCYFYQVRGVGKDGSESEPGPLVRTQPRVVEDMVVSVVKAKEVRLRWKPPAADVVGYHVERAVVEVFSEDELKRLKSDTAPLPDPSVGTVKAIGAFRSLTEKPLTRAEYVDDAVDLTKPLKVEGEPLFQHRFRAEQLDEKGKPYRYAVFAYRVRAVNKLGVESGPSPYFLTIPSAPQHVFAKEDEDSAKLKWRANPEEGIKGYRVYRMEGPKVNGPGQKVTRVTADPFEGIEFTDRKVGKDTRRYWIVAVDALGQEGIPSAPVWHYRQFRKYYLPFTGEWHQ